MPTKSVVIVAGGEGKRMGSKIPKQFMLLNGKPILMHTIEKFYEYSDEINIVLVLPEEYVGYWETLCIEHNFNIHYQFVYAGENRYESVRNGLSIVDPSGLVAIHDGVRPLVSPTLIDELFRKAEITGNAIPVVSIKESLRYVDENENKSVYREHYKTVQTPQVFNSEFIKFAYTLEGMPLFTDDASLIESLNIRINTIQGEDTNIKITEKVDLLLAEAIIKAKLV